MKKNIPAAFFTACCLLLVCCNTATPENYFDEAVLNCNMVTGFAGNGLQRELDQPSVKLVEGASDQSTPMKRMEIINNKIKFLDENFAKIKQLKETGDSKAMVQAAVSLYEYILPVYKVEYRRLAKLYDDNAPGNQLEALSKTIRNKYFTGFLERFNTLINTAKPYAERHHINVNWDIKTSPE